MRTKLDRFLDNYRGRIRYGAINNTVALDDTEQITFICSGGGFVVQLPLWIRGGEQLKGYDEGWDENNSRENLVAALEKALSILEAEEAKREKRGAGQ